MTSGGDYFTRKCVLIIKVYDKKDNLVIEESIEKFLDGWAS